MTYKIQVHKEDPEDGQTYVHTHYRLRMSEVAELYLSLEKEKEYIKHVIFSKQTTGIEKLFSLAEQMSLQDRIRQLRKVVTTYDHRRVRTD